MNFDEAIYDHVMVIAPTLSEADNTFNKETLLNYFDAGHSILMISDTYTKRF